MEKRKRELEEDIPPPGRRNTQGEGTTAAAAAVPTANANCSKALKRNCVSFQREGGSLLWKDIFHFPH
jgi:hypothetical protein